MIVPMGRKKTPENPSRGSLNAPFRKSFGNFRWGNSPKRIWWWKVREFPHPKMQRKIWFRQAYCWSLRILQTHQLRLRSYYATIYGPGFIATSKTGFASCHAVPRSKKNVVQVQRELGLDYAFANTLEVDETTGRWSHEEMKTGWWFQIFCIFTPIWGNDPTWLIFFKWVETTN